MVNGLRLTSINTFQTFDASCDLPGKTSRRLLTRLLCRVTQTDFFKTLPALQGDFCYFMLGMLTEPILQPLNFFRRQFLRFHPFLYRQRHAVQQCIYRAGGSPACRHCVHHESWTSYDIAAGKNTLNIGRTRVRVHFDSPTLGD